MSPDFDEIDRSAESRLRVDRREGDARDLVLAVSGALSETGSCFSNAVNAWERSRFIEVVRRIFSRSATQIGMLSIRAVKASSVLCAIRPLHQLAKHTLPSPALFGVLQQGLTCSVDSRPAIGRWTQYQRLLRGNLDFSENLEGEVSRVYQSEQLNDNERRDEVNTEVETEKERSVQGALGVDQMQRHRAHHAVLWHQTAHAQLTRGGSRVAVP